MRPHSVKRMQIHLTALLHADTVVLAIARQHAPAISAVIDAVQYGAVNEDTSAVRDPQPKAFAQVGRKRCVEFGSSISAFVGGGRVEVTQSRPA
jgi:hypothetical protein